MRHLGLLIGVSFLSAGLVFVLVLLICMTVGYGLPIPILAGALVFTATMLLAGRAYWQCSALLNVLCDEYAAERVLYSDVAGLMESGREHTGAIVVTGHRVVFRTPGKPGGKAISRQMDFPYGRIAFVKNRRGYFIMAAGGRENRFKVFRCDELVSVIQAGVDIVNREREERRQQVMHAVQQEKIARQLAEEKRSARLVAAKAALEANNISTTLSEEGAMLHAQNIQAAAFAEQYLRPPPPVA